MFTLVIVGIILKLRMNKILTTLTIIFLLIITGEVLYIFVYQSNVVTSDTVQDVSAMQEAVAKEQSSLIAPPQFNDIGVSLVGREYMKSAVTKIVVEGKVTKIITQNDDIILNLQTKTSSKDISLYLNKNSLDKAKVEEETGSQRRETSLDNIKIDQDIQISLEFDMLNSKPDNLYKSISILKLAKNE